MKEITSIPQDKLPIVSEKHHQKFLAKNKIHKGHKLWKMSLSTRTIEEVPFDKADATFAGGIQHKIITEKRCLYVTALNAKNADKQFFKMLGLMYPEEAKKNRIQSLK